MPAPPNNKNASKFDMKIVNEICNLVRSGMSIKKALSTKKQYPDFSTWCRWKRDNEIVYNQYINAIQDKSDMVDSEIDETLEAVKDGTLDPRAGNVIVQTLKWKAAKYYPKMFGDAVKHDHTTSDGSMKPIITTLTDAQLKELLKK